MPGIPGDCIIATSSASVNGFLRWFTIDALGRAKYGIAGSLVGGKHGQLGLVMLRRIAIYGFTVTNSLLT